MANLDLFKRIPALSEYYAETQKANAIFSQIEGSYTMPFDEMKHKVSDLANSIASINLADLEQENRNILHITKLADDLLEVMGRMAAYREKQVLLDKLPEIFECLITLKQGKLSLIYFGCSSFKYSAEMDNVWRWQQSDNGEWVCIHGFLSNYEFEKQESDIVGVFDLLTNKVSLAAGVVDKWGYDKCEKIKQEILSSFKNHPKNPFSFFKSKFNIDVKGFLSNVDCIELDYLVNSCFENKVIFSWIFEDSGIFSRKNDDKIFENNLFLMMIYFIHQNQRKFNLDFIYTTKSDLLAQSHKMKQATGKVYYHNNLSPYDKYRAIQEILNNSIWLFSADTPLKPRYKKMLLKADSVTLELRPEKFQAFCEFDVLKNNERSKTRFTKITLSHDEVVKC